MEGFTFQRGKPAPNMAGGEGTHFTQTATVEGERGQPASVGWLSSDILSRCVYVFLWHFWGRVTGSGLSRTGFLDLWCTFHFMSINVLLCSPSANSVKNPTLSLPSCPSTIHIQFKCSYWTLISVWNEDMERIKTLYFHLQGKKDCEKCCKRGILPLKNKQTKPERTDILEVIEQAGEGFLGEVSLQGWEECWNVQV